MENIEHAPDLRQWSNRYAAGTPVSVLEQWLIHAKRLPPSDNNDEPPLDALKA